jgi:uncharacterized GH25 family protein
MLATQHHRSALCLLMIAGLAALLPVRGLAQALTPTAYLQGTVTNNGTPVAGVTIDADASDGLGNVTQTTTDSHGNFTLGLSAGSWNLYLDGNTTNLVGPIFNEMLAANQTISGIAFPVLTATDTVTGTLTDVNGHPLSSAYGLEAEATIGELTYYTHGALSSSGNGTYSLGLVNGNWTFYVTGPSATNIQQTTLDITGNQTLNLAPPTPTAFLNGTVTDNGTAVAGLSITAYDVDGGGAQFNDQFTTASAANGTFSLGVIAGNWALSFYSSDPNQILPDYSSVYALANGANITGIAVPVLEATGQISGTVLAPNSQPIAEAYVSANATINGVTYNVSSSTDDNGNYSLPVANGAWQVSVSPNGFLNPLPQTVVVTGANQTANFTAPATAYLEGAVTDNGTAVAGVTIEAYDQYSDDVQATSAADGTFSLGVIAGYWTLYSYSSSIGSNLILPGDSYYTVTNGANITNISILTLTSSEQIAGTVLANGQPIPTGVSGDATINGVNYSVYDATDSNGNYSLGVANGTWEVYAYPTGYLSPTPEQLVVNGANQTANFTVPVTAYLEGAVTANGGPVAGVTIYAEDANYDYVSTTSATDGTFSLGVIAGNWTLSFYDYESDVILPTSTFSYPVTDGVNITNIVIPVLEANETISGVIVDTLNQPITTQPEVTANATINNLTYTVSASAGGAGNYSLGVGNGAWQVSVSTESGVNPTPQNVTVNGANQTANFTVPFTAYLEGVVTDNGAPVAGVTIEAEDENYDYVQTASAANGTFNLGVIAGNWTLYFGSSDPNVILPATAYAYTVTDGANITNISIPVLETNETISGTIFDADGQPLATSAGATATATLNGTTYTVSGDTGYVSVGGATVSNGNYSLGVANGTWQVSVSTQSGVNPLAQNVVVNGANQTANFTVPTTAALLGVVTDNGSPVAGVTIGAEDENYDYVQTTSAANGTFDLGVIGGNWTLYLSSSDPNLIFPTSTFAYAVMDGININNIVIPLLEANEQISGLVLDENNNPVASAAVTASLTSNGVTYSVVADTGANGLYVLGVANGSWQVSVSTPDDDNPAPQQVVVNGANQTANFSQPVPTAPAFTTQPQNLTLLVGQTGNISVAANGVPAPSYQWQISTDAGNTWSNLSNNTTYAGTTTATLGVFDATADLSGCQFQCLVTNFGGSIISNISTLTINTLPQTAWGQAYFTTEQLGSEAVSGPTASPAGDGIPNLMKYAFDLNPWVNGRADLPQPAVVDGQLTLTFDALQSDIAYTVEASTDLVNWSTEGVTLQSDGNQITASYPLTGHTPAFMRVVVTPAPVQPASGSGGPALGIIGGYYSYTPPPLPSSELFPPITWSLAPGSASLPPGLSLNPSTGEITGITNVIGVYTITLQATDQYGDTISITITLIFVLPGRGVPVVQLYPTQLSLIMPNSTTFTIVNVGPVGSVLNYTVADDGALGGFLNLGNNVGSLSAGQSAEVSVSIQSQFENDDTLDGATLVANVYTPDAANYVKTPVSINVFNEQQYDQSLVGEWSGNWTGPSYPYYLFPPGENNPPFPYQPDQRSATWTLDVQSLDLANSTVTGTLTWDSTISYWTSDSYYSNGTTNIHLVVPIVAVFSDDGESPLVQFLAGGNDYQDGFGSNVGLFLSVNALSGQVLPASNVIGDTYISVPNPDNPNEPEAGFGFFGIINENTVTPYYFNGGYVTYNSGDLGYNYTNPENIYYYNPGAFYSAQHEVITGSHVSSP